MTQLNIGQELITGLHYSKEQIDLQSAKGKTLILSALTNDKNFWLRNKTNWNCLLADSFGVNHMRSCHDPLTMTPPATDDIGSTTNGYELHFHHPVTEDHLEHVLNIIRCYKNLMIEHNLPFLIEILSDDQGVLDAIHELADFVVDYTKGFLTQPIVAKTDPVIRLAKDMGAV